MADSNDLSSTEKLLDSIRGDTPPSPAGDASVPQPESGSGSPIKDGSIYNLCLGVHFGGNRLSLVLAGGAKRGGPRDIIKWQTLPYPENSDIKDEQFPAFLKSSLSSFLENKKKVSIWAAIETKDVKLRQLVLPNMPDAKMANAAMWALKKEVEFDPVDEIFDYEFISDVHVNGVKKKNVVAFTGAKTAVKEIQQLFKSAGYSLTGITATPFALQNCLLAGQPDTGGKPILVVNIRRYRSEIFCLANQGVIVARSIKTGSFSLVEASMESGMIDKNITDIPWILSARNRVDDPGFEEMGGAANRLVGKIQRTGEYCSNTYLDNEPIAKYYFFGETDTSPGFTTFLEEMMPDRTILFSPHQDNMAAAGVTVPADAQDRNGIIPALGIALSDNTVTPNFLYTHKEKAIAAKNKKINMGVIAAGIAGLLICVGVWVWFNQMENDITAKRTQVETQLARYEIAVTRDVLNKKITQAQKRSQIIRQYIKDYTPLAVIGELCSLTPENIALVSLDAGLTEDKAGQTKLTTRGKGKKIEAVKARHLRLQGVVTEEFTALESTLTGYVIALGDSPLFGEISVEDKEVEQKEEGSILKFTADMEIR